ncbi:MAG TPA: bacillithiol biosynthesis BshC, partial [Bacillaceae bacterium]
PEILQRGTLHERTRYMEAARDNITDALIEDMQLALHARYDELSERLKDHNPGLQQLAHKNLDFHIRQIDFLKRKVDESLMAQHEAELEKYGRIERNLRPDGHPQERIWNLFHYINERGLDFVSVLMDQPYTFDGLHKVIRI